MPWVGRAKYDELIRSAIRNETRAMNAENLVDLLRADLERLRQDFNELTRITAGRVPPKLSPEFTKDPFQEDRSLPEIFLTPDPDELGVSGEAILNEIERARVEGEQEEVLEDVLPLE